ncbi:hypothetical protein AOZ07_09645 [Glutamicibacter halophytocola]|nr:hypothetical protein AOZ07_09645 [Glutamicibacter halophytocola]
MKDREVHGSGDKADFVRLPMQRVRKFSLCFVGKANRRMQDSLDEFAAIITVELEQAMGRVAVAGNDDTVCHGDVQIRQHVALAQRREQ